MYWIYFYRNGVKYRRNVMVRFDFSHIKFNIYGFLHLAGMGAVSSDEPKQLKLDRDGWGAASGLALINGFNVVAIRVKYESCIIFRMIGPFARCAIIAPPMGQRCFVKCINSSPTLCLEGKVVSSCQFP